MSNDIPAAVQTGLDALRDEIAGLIAARDKEISFWMERLPFARDHDEDRAMRRRMSAIMRAHQEPISMLQREVARIYAMLLPKAYFVVIEQRAT